MDDLLVTIHAIGAELTQRGTVGEFYLDLPHVRTTTIVRGYGHKPAVVDYIFRGPTGLRLYDQNDACHDLRQQAYNVLQAVLANIKLTDRPEGHRRY